MEQQITTENRILMERARNALKGKWGLAAGVTFVYILILCVQEVPKVGQILSFILAGPMAVGFYTFALSVSRQQDAKLEQLFDGFQIFVKSLITYILMMVFIILWMLLLIIPGIIAAFSYSMTFFILAEDHSIEPMDALKKSKEMMKGHKWKLACLSFRFIGWILLCILTLGIRLFWVFPYMYVSIAQFYDDIKESTEIKMIETV